MKQINKKLITVKNLTKTMSDLIKNIIKEVDGSRDEMFKILEKMAIGS